MYVVHVIRHTESDGSYQVPLFYLDENVQGIVSENHAQRIALRIVGDNCTITAVKV